MCTVVDDKFLEELRRVLDYNPKTGKFTWKVALNRNKRIRVGNSAGHVSKLGRLCIGFKGKLHYAHRLAWLLTYGKWPEQVIDHVDGNPLNNRIYNLRDVSNKTNQENRRKARTDSRTGFLGVSPYNNSGQFLAKIAVDGEKKIIGIFLTAEEAHGAYLAAKRQYHEGNTL